jgi:LEA14-like dessication related protein
MRPFEGDQSTVSIRLSKHEQMEWWKCLVKGDQKINTQVGMNLKYKSMMLLGQFFYVLKK